MPLDTDIFAALEKLAARQTNRKARVFPVPTRTMNAQLLKETIRQRSQLSVRKMIRAENAVPIVEMLPNGDSSLHVLLCGDFVFFDLITACIAKLGPPRRLDISTLSLSSKNVDGFVSLLKAWPTQIHILLSVYFQKTSAQIFEELRVKTGGFPHFHLTVYDTHCKIVLLDYPERALVMESSANLRACRSLDQLTILDHRGLLEFHRDWMDEAKTNADLNRRKTNSVPAVA